MKKDDEPLPLPPPPRNSRPQRRQTLIRSVWSDNLEHEFKLIRSVIDEFPMISMDTEFPGIVVRPSTDHSHNTQRPVAHYLSLKANVDLLNIIQIGLTLADKDGNLPDLGTAGSCFIWEFNFRDFDVERDAHAHDSVELLRRQGIDFERNRNFGIDSERFAELMMSTGLVLNDAVSWVTFHSAYDFGYLVKCLTRRPLPGTLTAFLELVRVFFGEKVYDVKHLMRFCDNLHGGLDRVCNVLGVERVVGKSHQAGSDSLSTFRAYEKMKERLAKEKGETDLGKYANVLYGLEDGVL